MTSQNPFKFLLDMFGIETAMYIVTIGLIVWTYFSVKKYRPKWNDLPSYFKTNIILQICMAILFIIICFAMFRDLHGCRYDLTPKNASISYLVKRRLSCPHIWLHDTVYFWSETDRICVLKLGEIICRFGYQFPGSSCYSIQKILSIISID